MSNQVTFTIPGEMVTFNEYDKVARGGWQGANRLKGEQDWLVYLAIRKCLGPEVTLMKDAYPITVHFKWYRRNADFDIDNISFAAKYILDGMQKAKLIKRDNQKHVCGRSDEFLVDATNPRTEVTLTARAGF